MNIFSFFKTDGSARLMKEVKKIEALKPSVEAYSDDQLCGKTSEFRERIAVGESLDSLLYEAYAVVREASRRVLGMEHFPVQLAGGIALHRGCVAQMCTGEGKTLTATLPVYLNALEGKGVHVVTVNDYLARRDAEWMGSLYRFLGLSVGAVLSNTPQDERKAAYACDVTYVTGSELGFDYLRDNMARNADSVVLRGLHYAVIDEADSVLIDAARTPLIISSGQEGNLPFLRQCDVFAKSMSIGKGNSRLSRSDILAGTVPHETGDMLIDEKEKSWVITDRGVEKAERFFKIPNYSASENLPIRHGIDNAVRANFLMKKDVDYIVKDSCVLLIDPFTGRVLDGHRFSDGLHQAIEAKEGVPVTAENKTLATITYQSFFNKFEKKSGMTGTAETEKKEFADVYGMDVVVIPPNKPVIRKDMPDILFRSKKDKYEAVLRGTINAHKKGQPVLIGTASIDVSEHISDMLSAAGIPHMTLNAKNDEREAAIIEKAGVSGAVTVATDMAGRGTDIVPDEDALDAGGLYVIGTERHESRRIDDQLRGRSGRQGNPGMSRFFLSVEDDLLRLFGGDACAAVFDSGAFGVADGEGLSDKSITHIIENAQKRIEGDRFSERLHLLEYDLVLDEQRDDIYRQRADILHMDRLLPVIKEMIEFVVGGLTGAMVPEKFDESFDFGPVNNVFMNIFFSPGPEMGAGTRAKYATLAVNMFSELLNDKMSRYEEDAANENIRGFLLFVTDDYWSQFLENTEVLKKDIALHAYASRDPLIQYRVESYKLFNVASWMIMVDVLTNVFRLF